MNFAVIKTGGKQYLVSEGQSLKIEKLPGEKGDSVTFEEILMVATGKDATIGKPMIKGASVSATIVKQARGPKIEVVKYKPKVRYRKMMGHRQFYTEVTIDKIKA